MTSRSTPLERAEAALAVQRRATKIYQDALDRACVNLAMLGRGDVVKSLNDATLKAIQAIPQPKEDDDDLAG